MIGVAKAPIGCSKA